MEDNQILLLVASFVLGALMLVIGYIANRRGKSSPTSNKNGDSKIDASNSQKAVSEEGEVANANAQSGKRAKNKKRREIQQEFTHSWMVGALKGHTAPVLDMNFSSNGKFLASCAEDCNPEPGKELELRSCGSYDFAFQQCKMSSDATSSEDPDKNLKASPNSADRLSRRQRKNRTRMREQQQGARKGRAERMQRSLRRVHHHSVDSESSSSDSGHLNSDVQSERSISEENCETSAISCEENAGITAVPFACWDECLLKKQGFLDHADMEQMLHGFVLSKEQLIENGYPVVYDPSAMFVQTSSKRRFRQADFLGAGGCVLIPGRVYYRGWMPRNSPAWKAEPTNVEKGGSAESSDQDSSSDSENVPPSNSKQKYTLGMIDGVMYYCYDLDDGYLTRRCSRCEQDFAVRADDLEYAWEEDCRYHPEIRRLQYDHACTCCGRSSWSAGCTVAKSHVWSGSNPGLNGPYNNFVQTCQRQDGELSGGVYSLDCEMCFTKEGLELARVTVIDLHGQIAYDHIVKPLNEIIDYNTRFSGITEHDFDGPTKSLAEVQVEILEIIHADTVVVGHALENDFRALKLVHNTVIDTSLLGSQGKTSRVSLKRLASCTLQKTIQTGSHDSTEDAMVAMELVLHHARTTFDAAHR